MQPTNINERFASSRRALVVLRSSRVCALFVAALSLAMVVGCASTGDRPRLLQRFQDRKLDSKLDDAQKDAPSVPSDPLKVEDSSAKTSSANAESGALAERSQYVDNAAAKDTSGASAGQAVDLPYRSYAPSRDQDVANTQPTLETPQIPDPTIETPKNESNADVSPSASASRSESAPVVSDPQPEPVSESQTVESASSTPEPPVVSEPAPETSSASESDSSVPNPPTTFEPASATVEQSVGSEPESTSETSEPEKTEEPEANARVESSEPESAALQGDVSVGELAKEAVAEAESKEEKEDSSSEASGSAPESTPEAAPVAEGNPEDASDDSNWNPKISASKPGRNVQLKSAVYSRVRPGNAKSSRSLRANSAAQRVEVPKTASVVVGRVAPIVPVQANGASTTEEYVDASQYRGRRAR